MPAAVRAADLGAGHPVAVVRDELDAGGVGRLGEARPARARVELGVGAEQLRAAAGTDERAVGLGVEELARERALGGAVAQDLELVGVELLAPLLLGLGDLGHRW